MSDTIILTEDQTAELAEMFKLLGDPTRLRVILACMAGPLSVTEAAQRVGISTSLVSHHLRLLRAARLLRSDRQGKQVFYRAADDHIMRVVADMAAHVGEEE